MLPQSLNEGHACKSLFCMLEVPFAFFDRTSNCHSITMALMWHAGRLVVEVFEDQAPLAARHLINRCREGTTDTLQLTYVHRLLPDMAMFFGTSHGCAALALSALQLAACTSATQASSIAALCQDTHRSSRHRLLHQNTYLHKLSKI